MQLSGGSRSYLPVDSGGGYQPTSGNYALTTGLLMGNPFYATRYTEFDAWQDGFKTKLTTASGLGGMLGTSLAMNLGMKVAMPGIARTVSLLGFRSPLAAFLISTTALSALSSGGMTLFQRVTRGVQGDQTFFEQWRIGFLYSMPSMLLGMGAMQRWGFGVAFAQDLILEVPQAGLSVAMTYGLQRLGWMETNMSASQLFIQNLCDGMVGMASGRSVGGAVTGVQSRLSTISFGNNLAWQTAPVAEWGGVGDRGSRKVSGPAFGEFLDIVVRRKKGEPKERRIVITLEKSPLTGPADAPVGKVWVTQNLVSSMRATDAALKIRLREARLEGLPSGATTLKGQYAEVTGKEPLGGDFSQPPVQVARIIDKKGRAASALKWNDKGAQVQAYYAVNSYLSYLASLGFDVKALLGATHKGASHPVRVLVNEFEDMNAYAMPGEDYIAFGTSNGKWSLGADHDVVMHECDHLLTFHAIPQLRGTEGGAIHEGGADAAAAICHRDAEMSEDFGLMLGGRPGPSVGLRTANNTLTMSDVGEEPHDRGEVYSGYWWSLMERIGHDPRFDKLTPEVRSGTARDLAMRLYYNHKLAYPSFNPTPADFVDAVLRAARGLEEANKGGGKILPIPLPDLEAKILAVAADRELLKAPKPPVIDDIEIETGNAQRPGIDNARRWWRDREIHFRRFSQAPGLGFETETLQQIYWCERVRMDDGTPQGKELAVDVVGHGLNSWTANGRRFEVSHKDVREIRAGDIDERMNVSFGKAVEFAQKRLVAELQEALEEWEKVQRRQPRTRAETKSREGAFLKYQMLKLVEALMKKPHEIPQRLVIVGEDRYLSWAVKLGPLTFYIPALSNYLRRKDAIRLDNNIFYCSHSRRAPSTVTA